MQASLETEAKGRAELLRVKKKLESDINELEIALGENFKQNIGLPKKICIFLSHVTASTTPHSTKLTDVYFVQ